MTIVLNPDSKFKDALTGEPLAGEVIVIGGATVRESSEGVADIMVSPEAKLISPATFEEFFKRTDFVNEDFVDEEDDEMSPEAVAELGGAVAEAILEAELFDAEVGEVKSFDEVLDAEQIAEEANVEEPKKKKKNRKAKNAEVEITDEVVVPAE
jgi:hypothetical protein